MLKALGFDGDDIPQLIVHGWWNISGAKMSKSLGNVVDPDLLADKYGADAVRYYLVSDIATGKDADFSEERLIQRYNSDLANSLGNLLNRTLSMAAKYRGGVLNQRATSFVLPISDTKQGTIQELRSMIIDLQIVNYRGSFEESLVQAACDALFDLVNGCNRSIDSSKPWALAKDAGQTMFLDAVLYDLAESLRIIAILLSPVLPKAAHGIFDQLNWKMGEQGQETRFRLADATWGGLPDGHVLGTPTPLFPRIETEAKPT
jgi:methionyl-tRNA synthetase